MKRLGVVALLTLLAASAHSQGLPDPTRPAVGPGSGTDGMVTLPQLQVVLIGRGPAGRRVAVISGQTLRIGDKFDGAVLTGISANQVVLRNGNKMRVLKLFPVPEQHSGGPDGGVK